MNNANDFPSILVNSNKGPSVRKCPSLPWRNFPTLERYCHQYCTIYFTFLWFSEHLPLGQHCKNGTWIFVNNIQFQNLNFKFSRLNLNLALKYKALSSISHNLFYFEIKTHISAAMEQYTPEKSSLLSVVALLTAHIWSQASSCHTPHTTRPA